MEFLNSTLMAISSKLLPRRVSLTAIVQFFLCRLLLANSFGGSEHLTVGRPRFGKVCRISKISDMRHGGCQWIYCFDLSALPCQRKDRRLTEKRRRVSARACDDGDQTFRAQMDPGYERQSNWECMSWRKAAMVDV